MAAVIALFSLQGASSSLTTLNPADNISHEEEKRFRVEEKKTAEELLLFTTT